LTGRRTEGRTAARRRGQRTGERVRKGRRRGLSWPWRLAAGAATVVLGLLAWGVEARATAPAGNCALERFDAIIVLGAPADADGNPTPAQLARVAEAVREYERGVAPRLILTGGAAHNRFVEAEVMARTAEAQGIPADAIVVEPEARDTIENACYAERIMQAHGWSSAEVVSSAAQLPRAGLIFNRQPLEWRAHAAPPLGPEPGSGQSMLEVLKTVRYLAWAREMERCEP
jgi:uncharacterized SAM-binding protein YcdF (DUF218 family)